jgi:actin-related protein 5
MVDIPDAELDDEGKKEKRKQRLLKSNYDARMRMKAEKRAEKERIVSRGIIRVLPFRM